MPHLLHSPSRIKRMASLGKSLGLAAPAISSAAPPLPFYSVLSISEHMEHLSPLLRPGPSPPLALALSHLPTSPPTFKADMIQLLGRGVLMQCAATSTSKPNPSRFRPPPPHVPCGVHPRPRSACFINPPTACFPALFSSSWRITEYQMTNYYRFIIYNYNRTNHGGIKGG